MDRPYIFCHMMTSLDGKITGPFMDTEAAGEVGEEYERINRFYAPQAWVNGRVTIDENFTFGTKPELLANSPAYPKEDYVSNLGEASYLVAIDPHGRLGWQKNFVEYANRPKAYVIEVLTEGVSNAYLHFLHQRNIPYIFAGKDSLNCTLAVEKLKGLFGIEKLKLSGGGVINASFLREGLIDELSLLIVPAADAERTTPTLFERADYLPPIPPATFHLKAMEQTKGSGVWLRYLAAHAQK